MTAGDNNWPAVVGNLSKARKSWGRLSRILRWEGADARVSGNVFKAVVQAVLLFGAETWVLTLRTERAMESFQHRAARQITGRQPQRRRDERWTYPPLDGLPNTLETCLIGDLARGPVLEVLQGPFHPWGKYPISLT